MRIEWLLQRREGTYPRTHSSPQLAQLRHTAKPESEQTSNEFLEIILIKAAWTLLLFGCMSDLNFVKLVPLRFLKIYYNYDR